MSAVNHLQSAFDEVLGYSCYHPNKGYWWDFKKETQDVKEKAGVKKEKEEPSSIFQRKRVDILLGELTKKFPFKLNTSSEQTTVENKQIDDGKSDTCKVEVLKEKTDTLNERVKPPPEKKPRLN